MSASNRRVVIKGDPSEEPGEGCLEFRLTYEGPLKGANGKKTRAEHKHEIRRAFHPQLKRQFELNRGLAQFLKPSSEHGGRSFVEARADLNQRFGYRFMPMVTPGFELLCSLDILFLRPGERGGVLQGGDIDNRLKTLFDALCLPVDGSGVGLPREGEDPFYCLLLDDRLITHVAVETDVLLQPVSQPENANDARLVITVRLDPYVPTIANSMF
jgi:hypothetical protein